MFKDNLRKKYVAFLSAFRTPTLWPPVLTKDKHGSWFAMAFLAFVYSHIIFLALKTLWNVTQRSSEIKIFMFIDVVEDIFHEGIVVFTLTFYYIKRHQFIDTYELLYKDIKNSNQRIWIARRYYLYLIVNLLCFVIWLATMLHRFFEKRGKNTDDNESSTFLNVPPLAQMAELIMEIGITVQGSAAISVYLTFCDLLFLRLQTMCAFIKDKSSIDEQALREIHEKWITEYTNARKVDDLFHTLVFVWYSILVPVVIFVAQVVTRIVRTGQINDWFEQIPEIIYSTTIFTCISLSGSRIIELSSTGQHCIMKLPLLLKYDNIQLLIKTSLTLNASEVCEIRLTCWRTFIIGRPLLMSIFGVIFTYGVVIQQIAPQLA